MKVAFSFSPTGIGSYDHKRVWKRQKAVLKALLTLDNYRRENLEYDSSDIPK